MTQNYLTKTLTPLQAIRRKCLWCDGYSAQEVRLCPVEGCSLWEYRFGKRPGQAKLTPIRAIKAKCRDCCGETTFDVKACPGLQLDDGLCTLHGFRLGRNPNFSSETREAARKRAQAGLLVEKGGRSPVVGDSKDEGRGILHAVPDDDKKADYLPLPIGTGNEVVQAR